MDERITIILAVTISYVIICIIIGSRISKNYFSKYLKGNRVKILKGEIPEMNYDPDRNILNRKTIEREYKTSAVQTNISMHKYLGNMTFSGKYKDIHIEDSLFSHVYPTRSHPSNEHHRHHPSDYFEQIMVYCDIPSDSILNELQYVRFYRTDSYNYKFGTTIIMF